MYAIRSYYVDAGDIILQKKTPIYEEDTLETLHDRLAQIGSEALMETVDLGELRGIDYHTGVIFEAFIHHLGAPLS